MTPASVVRGLLGLAAAGGLAATIGVGLSLPPSHEQAEYARLIAIHPPLAWVAYMSFATMALGSLLWLLPATRHHRFDRLAAAGASVGVIFTALMLATGSIWGRPTWGVWWVWDARLTISALMLAMLVGYGALRRATPDPERRATVSAVAGLLAVLLVPINHFAVTWWRTLHQGRSLARPAPESQLDPAYIQAMLLGFVSMTLVFAWMVWKRAEVERLAAVAHEAELRDAIDERRRESSVLTSPSPAGRAPAPEARP